MDSKPPKLKPCPECGKKLTPRVLENRNIVSKIFSPDCAVIDCLKLKHTYTASSQPPKIEGDEIE